LDVEYPHVFAPLQVGGVTMENRLVMAATATVFFEGDGLTSERERLFLRERARGGVGLIVTGNRVVHPSSGAPCRGYAWAFREEMAERDRLLTRTVHEFGTPIFAQLNHFGAHANTLVGDDYRPLWSPSAMKSPAWGETPKELEAEELAELVASYARCAELTREGGFDGVELHMANGYLLHEFVSEIYNKREDGYGGSLENRLRFPLEVLRAVRARVGSDFVVGVRLAADEAVPGGMGPEQAVAVAETFAGSGDADYIGLAGGTYHSYAFEVAPPDIPEGWLLEAAAAIKAAVPDLPVFASGALQTPERLEALIAAGHADAILMARGFLADPEYAVKVREGRQSELTRCIRCNQCLARLYRAAPIACTVNPSTGREQALGRDTLRKADRPSRWLVVGGGPAGMKAATVLAGRGHAVTLLERSENLGGQVMMLLKTPRRETFRALIDDLSTQLRRLGVDVRLGIEASTEAVLEHAADGVVLATGSLPLRTGFSTAAPFTKQLPGVDQPNVLTALDVLDQPERAGSSVLLLDDDGTRYSTGTAEVLLDTGRTVHVVTRFQSLGPRLAETLDQAIVYARLFRDGFELSANSWVRRIEGSSAVVYNLYTNRETALTGIDTFVLATGHHANDVLYHELKGTVPNLWRIGDCLAPRLIDHALYEAELAGREALESPEHRPLTGTLAGPPRVAGGTARPPG
jgi:2,4-dienoyl-CoA reductase-like NADH-dependent reductase (Old Yellow Enzyme family)/pyruvate/2-oxoglutarate dehydrogenase complex dihydrolipoamide dehydrogenase (E3) component